MPKLVAEVTADTSGLETGLRRADGMVEKFGEKVKHHLLKSFGVTFLAGAVGHSIHRFIEDAEKISEGAAKLKITTDEYQGLEAAARKAGLGVEEFIEANKKNGVSLDQQIVKLGDFKEAIKHTREEIEEWKEMKEAGGAFVGGVTGPVGIGARKGWNLLAGGLLLGRAALSALFHTGDDASRGDLLLEAMKHGAEYHDEDLTWFREGSDSSALPLPARTRLKRRQKGIDKLQKHLDALVKEEKDLRRPEPHTAWLAPGTTDWQSMGAMTRMPSVAVTDAERQNQEQLDKLEEVRKEIAETKEAIRKMTRGED